MATTKKRARTLGKKIRLETGLALPIAMRAAKLIERGRGIDILYHATLSEFAHPTYYSCGPECCGSNGHKLVGPRGEYPFSLS
jgi:hypothetical protein